MDLRVLQFVDDGNVWITIHPLSKLQEYEREASLYASEAAHNNLPPKKSEMCLVKWKGRWCRAEVKRAFISLKYGTVAEIFLMDHGATVSSPLQSLIGADNSMLSMEPPLAERYKLAPRLSFPDLPPSIKSNWTDAVTNILHNVISDGIQSDGWGLKMKGRVMEDGCLELYHVTRNRLGDVHSEEEISFNRMLIEAGLLKEWYGSHKDKFIESSTVMKEEPVVSESTITEDTSHSGQEMTSCSKETVIMKPSPDVYIEGVTEHSVWNTLEDSLLPSSVCSALKQRGFKLPTLIQSHGWPHIWNGRDTVLLSPHRSGKTLTYLLPLLCSSEEKESESFEPQVIILVGQSYKSWHISNQATTILSWLNAAKRFSCCPVYATAESTALTKILNGVDVIVTTPTSLLRLLNKDLLTLNHVKHIVFDDIDSLFSKFSDEVHQIMKIYARVVTLRDNQGRDVGWHIIACCYSYSSSAWEWLQQYLYNPVTIVTCPIELVILKKLKCHMISLPSPSSSISHILLLTRSASGKVVVCVQDKEEAMNLIQCLNLHCVNGVIWKQGLTPPTDVAIVFDNEYQSLVIDNISHLVHYTLPPDKTTFRHRLALLIPSILSNYSPSISIFITPECHKQSTGLLTLMERLCQSPPTELVTMAEDRKKEQQLSSQLSLCHYLKAYGECILGKECKQVHSLEFLEGKSHLLAKPQLPKDGVVKVFVEYVSSPVQLWIRILDHTPLLRGEHPVCPSSLTISQISMDLALYYSEPIHRVLHTNPREGDVCGLRETTGEYYRAQIIEFSSPLGLYFHHKEQAKIRLIDIGAICIVDVNQLLTLPSQFMTTPPLVIEAFVCGLIAHDKDIDWSPEAVDKARSLLERRTLVGPVSLSLPSTLWLDPIEERVVLNDVGVSTALGRPQTELVRVGVACKNPNHLMKLRSVLDMEISSEIESMKFDSCKTASPSMVEPCKVILTAIESLQCLYLQLVTAKPQLQEIIDRLNCCSTRNTSFDKILCSKRFSAGDICAAKFPFDDIWYRACVMDMREGEEKVLMEYLCFFVDYGDLEWVCGNDVEPMSPQLLELPFQAIPCSLDVTNRLDVDEDAYEKLWYITRDQTLTLTISSSSSSSSSFSSFSSSFPYPTSRHSVCLLSEEGVDVLTLLTAPLSSSPVDDENYYSETIGLLNLVLSEELSPIEFLQYVINKRGKIALSHRELDILISVLGFYEVSNDVLYIIKGLSLLSSVELQSTEQMISHTGLCQIIMELIKDPNTNDVLLSCVQLLKCLILSTRDISIVVSSFPDLIHTLTIIIQSSSTLPIIGHCLDIVSCLVSKECISNHSVLVKILTRVLKHLDNTYIQSSCVRFICVLIVTGNSDITQHMDTVLTNARRWPVELREDFLQSLYFCIANSPFLTTCHRFLLELNQKSNFETELLERITVPNSKHLSTNTSIMNESVPHVSDRKSNTTDSTSTSTCGGGVSHNSTPTDSGMGTDVMSHNTMYNNTCLSPKVLWSQNHSIVTLSVQLRGCVNYHTEFHENSVKFWGQMQDKMYNFSLYLFGLVIKEQCHVIVGGGEVIIKIKKVHDAFWPRLTRTKSHTSFVSIDYERWNEETTSSEEEKQHKICWDSIHKRIGDVNANINASCSSSEEYSDIEDEEILQDLDNECVDFDID